MRDIGYVGAGLYGFLLIVGLWRTAIYWIYSNHSADIKLSFHTALVFCAALECLYFVSFSVRNGYNRWGYECHMFGLYFHALSVSLVSIFL
jgi:hypothetical protein